MFRRAGAMALLAPCLLANDAPSTFADVALMECEWISACRGLHVQYQVTEEVPDVRLDIHSPAPLVGQATTETWIDADGQQYRYETHVDHEHHQRELKQLAAAGVAAIDEWKMPDIFSDSLLVRRSDYSEWLPLDTAKMVMSWRIPGAPAGDPHSQLSTEGEVQPLYRWCVLHQLSEEGWYPTGETDSPFAPAPSLNGVVFAEERCQAAGEHATLSAIVSYPKWLPDYRMKLTLTLVRLGDPARWFTERISATTPDDEHGGATTVITWCLVPGASCVAVPERILRTANRTGRIDSECRATRIEAPASFPKETWSIDQSLARSIYDSTLEMMLMPEAF
jgi:hypothetical protein